MAINFSTPTTTDNYLTGFVPNIQANQIALAQWLDSTNTTITGTAPTYAKRYNRASGYIEEYSGTAWANITLNITGSAASATIATSASGSTFFTAATASEGQIGAKFSGQNDVYIFNNATQWGMYSASGGGAFTYTRPTTNPVTAGGFTFNGNATSATTAVTTTGNAATATTAGSAAKIANASGWNVTPDGTTLYFNYNGTNVAKLDSSGNLTVKADITAYGTI